jgi:hypothetical protein
MKPFVGGKLLEQIPARRLRTAIAIYLQFLAHVGFVFDVADFLSELIAVFGYENHPKAPIQLRRLADRGQPNG